MNVFSFIKQATQSFPPLSLSVLVHTQRPGSQERPGHREQRHEDRRLRSGQGRPQHRLLQKDDQCKSPTVRWMCTLRGLRCFLTAQIHLTLSLLSQFFSFPSFNLLPLLLTALTLGPVSWQEPQVPRRPVNVALLGLGGWVGVVGGGSALFTSSVSFCFSFIDTNTISQKESRE